MSKEEIKKMVAEAGYGTLATMDGDQPRVRPMMPCISDGGQILVSYLPGRRCIEQVESNQKVEMCFVDPSFGHCRLSGKAKVSNDIEKKTELWETIPYLSNFMKGPDDPEFGLIVIDVDYAEIMPSGEHAPIIVNWG